MKGKNTQVEIEDQGFYFNFGFRWQTLDSGQPGKAGIGGRRECSRKGQTIKQKQREKSEKKKKKKIKSTYIFETKREQRISSDKEFISQCLMRDGQREVEGVKIKKEEKVKD